MSEKLDRIIEELKTLTLLEASELVTQIEKVFGVDTTVSVNAGAVAMPVLAAAAAEVAEEQTSFDVILNEVPADKKIAILKIVRSITGFGLKESKDIVDNVPKVLKEGTTKEDSEKIKKELEEAGAKVILK
jgi:large subunit ribosomal protein L7/L12